MINNKKKSKQFVNSARVSRELVLQSPFNGGSLQIPRFYPKREVKYVETSLLANTSTGTVGFQILTGVISGTSQGQRIADTITVVAVETRMDITLANADVFATVRWMIFRWNEDTVSSAPTSGAIYSSPSSEGVNTPLSFENRRRFSPVTKDILVPLTGTITNPTSNTLWQAYLLHECNNRVDFNPGGILGVGHLYFCDFSDSTVTPFPVYDLVVRCWYYDGFD